MAAEKKIKTKSGVEVRLYSKSLYVNGGMIFNGHAFTESDMQVIVNGLNDAYKEGRNDKAEELKNKWKDFNHALGRE